MGAPSQPAGNTTTTTNSAPWAPQQPYLQNIFGSAQNLYNTGGPQYFPGTTYAPPTTYQNQGLDLLGSTGLWAGTAGAQPALGTLNSILGGNYLNANPAQALLGNIGASNLAQNNWPYGALQNIASGGTSLGTSAPYSGLLSLGGNNLGQNDWSYGVLQNQASGNPGVESAIAGIPGAVGGASNLAAGNLGNTQNLAYGTIAPTQQQIAGAVGGANPTLSSIANANGQIPLGYGAANELGGFANGPNIATQGQSANTLRQFASGAMSGNPVTGALANSVMAGVLPGIEQQFIQGGGLSSPGAAYAASQGVGSALAPIEYQQWQQEMANQLGAAGTLENAKLQGRGLQQQAALGQGQTAQAAAGLREGAALNQANLGLQGAQAEQAAALNPAQLVSGLGLNTANVLGSLGISGANTAGNLGLGEQAATTTAATNLGQQGLQGQQQQISALQNALSGALGGGQLQLGGANALGQQELAGQQNQISALGTQGQEYSAALNNMLQGLGLYPQTMQQPLSDLSTAAQAGQAQQGLQQNTINDAVQRYNYQQTLPYQALNQFIAQITGNYGGTSSLTQPFFQNQGANIGSGILGGLGAANLIGGSNGLFPGLGASIFGGGGLSAGAAGAANGFGGAFGAGALDLGLLL